MPNNYIGLKAVYQLIGHRSLYAIVKNQQ